MSRRYKPITKRVVQCVIKRWYANRLAFDPGPSKFPVPGRQVFRLSSFHTPIYSYSVSHYYFNSKNLCVKALAMASWQPADNYDAIMH